MRTCSIEGCGKIHFAHGWCSAHHTRWRRHGNPLSGGIFRKPPTSPFCSIEGCVKPVLACGWCNSHYRRWKRHGDTGKMLRPTNGDARRHFREVVLPYRGNECLIWPYSKVSGYGALTMGDGRRLVSRMVCEDRHGPPPTPKHDAAHSCGKGHLACVAGNHLSWKTRKENEADKILHGTSSRGERHGNCKITEKIARAIRARSRHEKPTEIAADVGISISHVRGIIKKRSWAWMGD